MSYITKEIGIDNLSLPSGVEILYSIWTVTLKETGDVVYPKPGQPIEDYENLTSIIFNNVFELGKTYNIKLAMVQTTGPTISTEAFEYTAIDNKDIIDLYPMPSVVDTPVLSVGYPLNAVPTTGFVVTGAPIAVSGNAVHEESDWWMMDDENKLIWKSLKDKVNLESIRITEVSLDPNKVYTIFCVYKGNNRDASAAGSLTIRPVSYSELDIEGTLDDSYYGREIDTNLLSIPNTFNSLEYELWGEDKTLIYSSTNTTGTILIPETLPSGKSILEVGDGYRFYKLRLRATIDSVVVGWKDILFTPKVWKVESIVYDDADFRYKNSLTPIKIQVEGFDASTFNDYNTGNTYYLKYIQSYQLPDGLFLLAYARKKYGLFKWNESIHTFTKVKDIPFSEAVAMDTTAGLQTFSWIMLSSTGNILITLGSSNGTDSPKTYAYKYNPIKKSFTFIEKALDSSLDINSKWISGDKFLTIDSTGLVVYDSKLKTRTLLTSHPFSTSSLIYMSIIDSRTVKIYSHWTATTGVTDGRSVLVHISEDYLTATTDTIVTETLLETTYPSSGVQGSLLLNTLRNSDVLLSSRITGVSTVSRWCVKDSAMTTQKVPYANININPSTTTNNVVSGGIHFNDGRVIIPVSLDGTLDSLIYS